jgi:hypothetical protein
VPIPSRSGTTRRGKQTSNVTVEPAEITEVVFEIAKVG